MMVISYVNLMRNLEVLYLTLRITAQFRLWSFSNKVFLKIKSLKKKNNNNKEKKV